MAATHPAENDARPDHAAVTRAWIAVVILTAVMTAGSGAVSLARYHKLESGWSWDLAYYNQWFWKLVHGQLKGLTVRPASAYAIEGPQLWKMNYLAPVRLVIAPIYALAPDPRTLLVIQCVIFWWVIPAAFGLVLAESRSVPLALGAAFLVPLSGLLWPLVWNDFRELQLALPFVLHTVQGVRQRSVRLAALGVTVLLACRQEFAVMIATFGFLPPAREESLSRTIAWRQALTLLGAAWFLFAFFGYLAFVVGRFAPDHYLNQFQGPRASIPETLRTSTETLLFGLGCWAILALFAPRVFVLAIPWIWGICSARWANRVLETTSWHHVRYTLPATSLVLAAGLVGYARIGRWLLARKHGMLLLMGFLIGCAAVNLESAFDTIGRLERKPPNYSAAELEEIWGWIQAVRPDEGVIADYTVTAPLSSRQRLYSYILEDNLPPGFPNLDRGIGWLFVKNDSPFLRGAHLTGFETVHHGRVLTILHRVP